MATLILAGLGFTQTGVCAQGLTTGAVTGTVTEAGGQPVADAEVVVINAATGFSSRALSRATGLYLIQGLEVGSQYTIRIQHLGFEAFERTGVIVTLGQATRVDVELRTTAIELGGIAVEATRSEVFSPTRQGVGTTVTDSVLRRVPTLSRDFMDLVKLTPQVVRPQDGNGPSAGGQYNRFNLFTIDGANQSDKFALSASGGSPGSSSGAKTISPEAIKEFRVMLSPTDVRQGNFTGMLVNAVTRNGTNDWTGGGTFTYRDESLAARFVRTSPVDVQQYSFQLGGPIIRDRLHFFIAPELQRRQRPAGGPYVSGGQGFNSLNISPDTIEAVIAAASGLGFEPGGVEQFTLENPTLNLFGRLDFQLNEQNRVVLRQIYNQAEDDEFSRNTGTFQSSPLNQNSGFRLGSNQYTREHENLSSVGQLFTNFRNGWSNELLLSYNFLRDERIVPQRAPEIGVGVVPLGSTSTTPTAVVTLGTEQFSPGNLLRQKVFEVTENLTIPFGAHTFTVGGRFEHTNIFNNFAQRSYGVWVFPDLAAFAARAPSGYAFGFDNSQTGEGIAADFSAQLFSLYAQDQWQVNSQLSISAGLRADIPRLVDEPLQNDRVADLTDGAINTSDVPDVAVLLSPRIGFNYDVTGNQSTQVRGNVGIFTGSPPYIMLGNAYANTGLGLVNVSCTAAGTVPEFTTDVDEMPRACLGNPDPAPNVGGTVGINITDKKFKYPQSFTGSLGFDQRLPFDMVLTLEGLYRKAINGLLIQDANLLGPRMVGGSEYTDRHGRVLYADTISATGSVTNNRRRITNLNGVNFTEGIIEVTNQSEDYNYTLSAQLTKRFASSMSLQASYTYMQAKDIQSLTSDRAISNFRFGRQLSTSHDDRATQTSYFERPHRIVLGASYTAPWKITDISVYYQGISGTPFTYVYSGDVNGDLVNGNDPIYVPEDATDVDEIRIGSQSGGVFTQDAAAAARFNQFVEMQDCLSEQRGAIMERNSCRSPFQHTMDLSIRQSLPRLAALRGNALALQLDIFNFLGWLGGRFGEDWGRFELPTLSPNFTNQSVLQSTGRTPGPLDESLPVVTFNPTVASLLRPDQNPPSGCSREEPCVFTKQTGVASYYQMQLTLRWTF